MLAVFVPASFVPTLFVLAVFVLAVFVLAVFVLAVFVLALSLAGPVSGAQLRPPPAQPNRPGGRRTPTPGESGTPLIPKASAVK